MLEFLKNSTFRANEVFFRALNILKKHYISIAGLCFMLFITNTLSAFLALYFNDLDLDFIKALFSLFFIVVFFGLQLVLIKRAVLLAKNIEHAPLMTYIPSVRQFLNFILGLVIYSLLLLLAYLVCAVVCWPLLYLGVEMNTILWEVNPFLTGVLMMLILVRISFFPFFILEKGFNIIRAFKLSIAFTKGNVINLLVLILFLALTYIFQLTFEYFGYFLLAKIAGILNTFVVIPMVSVAMAIAYVDMMEEYKGSDDPELFKNIL